MIVKLKKINKGHVAVRSYLIKRCIDKMEDLIVEAESARMTVPLSRIKSLYQTHKVKYNSRFNQSSKYEPIYIHFIPDKS